MIRLAVAAGAATVGAVVGGMLGTVPDVSRIPVESVDSGDVWVSRAAPVGARDLQVTLSNGDVFDLPPCQSDDGRNCYWDALTFGDGSGESFVSLPGLVLWVNIDGMGADR